MRQEDSGKHAGNDVVNDSSPESAPDADAFGFRAWARSKAIAREQAASDADTPSESDADAASHAHAVSQATHNAMAANRGRDTKPELLVRHALREAGLPGYRLQWKAAPGRPDIAYPGRHIAIYVDGCFWHRCPYCNMSLPKSNVDYWRDKFRHNIERDRRCAQQARDEGWEVIRIWECQLKGDRREQTLREIIDRVRNAGKQAETGAGASNASVSVATTYTYAQVEVDKKPAKKEETADA